ncbi:unnamed protein product [Paramecium sonneborni]|uniref:Uncharacterized protein n=1 Tax=Paramecium sonneborni TaxID=65129 RepID=A0A8S1R4A7_9CILI|nr:unnamed protein product [Paramecium sonneborni]
MESEFAVGDKFASYFSDFYDQRILISIYLLFPLILIFFLLSLRDLEKLENQETYDKQHTIYQPNIYNNLVNQWTQQGIQNLKQDKRYIDWQLKKEREIELRSQESSKLSFRQLSQ